jgi:hypothetical protein
MLSWRGGLSGAGEPWGGEWGKQLGGLAVLIEG